MYFLLVNINREIGFFLPFEFLNVSRGKESTIYFNPGEFEEGRRVER